MVLDKFAILHKLLQSSNIGYTALDALSASTIAAVSRGPIVCVPSSALKRKCVFVNGSTSSYVLSFPNSLVYD